MEYIVFEETVEITNKLGIHARPAALFVKEAARYKSDVYVLKNGQEVNGKSIMGVMMLAVECGSKITIKARGPDSEDAVRALVSLVRSKFMEE
jgi:phosphocarrier protein HPr